MNSCMYLPFTIFYLHIERNQIEIEKYFRFGEKVDVAALVVGCRWQFSNGNGGSGIVFVYYPR